jgi:Icc-related predicted phosphoesterase
VIRIAAVADVHFGTDSAGSLRPHLAHLEERADVLLLAGDLTRHGEAAEAEVFAREVEPLSMPKLAVLGNHDFHSDQEDAIAELLETAGVRVLEGDSAVVDVNGTSLAIAGVKGFGGGFAGACATDFGEPEMKAFVRHTKVVAARLSELLHHVEADVRVALMHYSPVEDTLLGERLEIYPFLGSYLLGEAVDSAGADLVIHGHAHAGSERGVTPGGIQVRNVAQPVIRRAYSVFCFEPHENGSGADERGMFSDVQH